MFATGLPDRTRLHHQLPIQVLCANLLHTFRHRYTQAFSYRLIHPLPCEKKKIPSASRKICERLRNCWSRKDLPRESNEMLWIGGCDAKLCVCKIREVLIRPNTRSYFSVTKRNQQMCGSHTKRLHTQLAQSFHQPYVARGNLDSMRG